MRSFKLLHVLVGAGVVLGCVHLSLLTTVGPGDRFFAFIYQRSPVQHATLLVASIVIVLLFARFYQYRWSNKRFAAFEKGDGKPPRELAEQIDVVRSTRDKHGAAAAFSRAEQVAGKHAANVQKAYETIYYLAGILPGLGLFGTMLGLSNSLFVAFGDGAEGSASVRMFITALSTAMDTTVLAMACAVPLFGCAWLLGRLESELGDRYAEYVRKQFGLDEIATGDRNAAALHSEFRRLTRRLGVEAKAAFAQLLQDSATAYRETLEQVVEEVFDVQRKHDKETVKKVAAEVANSLGQSVNRVGDLMERQNGRLAEGMIHQVEELEKVLQNRTPEEVIIRYQNNGHATKE